MQLKIEVEIDIKIKLEILNRIRFEIKINKE